MTSCIVCRRGGGVPVDLVACSAHVHDVSNRPTCTTGWQQQLLGCMDRHGLSHLTRPTMSSNLCPSAMAFCSSSMPCV